MSIKTAQMLVSLEAGKFRVSRPPAENSKENYTNPSSPMWKTCLITNDLQFPAAQSSTQIITKRVSHKIVEKIASFFVLNTVAKFPSIIRSSEELV